MTFEALGFSNFDEQFVVRSLNKFCSACDIMEKLWIEEVYDMEKSHAYHPVVKVYQADNDLFTHKTIDLERKKNRVISFSGNTANTTQEGDEISLDSVNQPDCSNFIYAPTVEGDRPCTYFTAKTDAHMQMFEDTYSINQSSHSNVIYAQPLEGDISRQFF